MNDKLLDEFGIDSDDVQNLSDELGATPEAIRRAAVASYDAMSEAAHYTALNALRDATSRETIR